MADLDQYYRILGVEPGASPKKVKQAYRDLMWVWHPDRFEGNRRLQQVAQEKLKEINNAYEPVKSAAASSCGYGKEEQRNNRASEDRKKNHEQSASTPPPKPDVTAKSKSVQFYVALGFLLLVFFSFLHRQLSKSALKPAQLPQVNTDSNPPTISGGEPSVPTSAPITNHSDSST